MSVWVEESEERVELVRLRHEANITTPKYSDTDIDVRNGNGKKIKFIEATRL